MKYVCVSKLILGEPCNENCKVTTTFKPAVCLKAPVWATWAEAKKKKAEQDPPKG